MNIHRVIVINKNTWTIKPFTIWPQPLIDLLYSPANL